MLKRTFKTARELNLTEAQHKGLVNALGILERDELPLYTAEISRTTSYKESTKMPVAFNMCIWHNEMPECGTVCCIGGLASATLGVFDAYGNIWDKDKEGLAYLFYPGPHHRTIYRSMSDYTIPEAIKALRSYLETGKPDWS